MFDVSTRSTQRDSIFGSAAAQDSAGDDWFEEGGIGASFEPPGGPLDGAAALFDGLFV